MRFERFPSIITASLLALTLGSPAGLSQGAAGEITFIEQFALASDRATALAQLIPGTEDYYYYHCLHYQNLQQYERVEELLKPWVERHKETARVREIRNRQALLTYRQDPQTTLAYLRSRLGLRFDHQRETVDRASQLPSELNRSLISRDRLRELALRRHRNLNGFEDSALAWLAATDLDADRRRELLQRLSRPDVHGLVKLVMDDIRASRQVTFGTHPIHAQLLRKQLDELLRLDGSLLNQTNFVNAYLSKLTPPADVDWQNDLDARQQQLDELWRFVSRLSPAHNSLKTHVLYHRLALDIQHEQYDKSRLMTYLKLPRGGAYINPRYVRMPVHRRSIANLGQDFRANTGLPPVGNDEPVVRQYLQHMMVEAASYREYDEYVRDDYLKRLFAETKIVNGLGDPEQWASLLTPESYQRLRERVDLEFAASNRREFSMDREIVLDLFVKNVPSLIIKVYRINALNYYQDLARHVDTAVNLDGLVANHEVTTTYDDSPFRRTRRHLTFPELSEPGVYVIDFIGNGKSSRALIHKGQLRQVSRKTAAGYAFTVLDEQNNKLSDARIWMAGKFYEPESNGEILIPYSTEPRQQSIVLVSGPLATLNRFAHGAETYQLQAGIHLDRESLRSRRVAPLLIRPLLTIAGTPISLAALERPRLEITSVDFDGVKSTTTVNNLELHDDRDLVHSLRVPPRLSQLSVVFKGRVTSLSENKTIDLQVAETFNVNGIEGTHSIDQLELVRTDRGHVIDVIGKTGEAKPNRPVTISIKHRDFRDIVKVVLRSDETGRVHLGTLDDIQHLTAQTDGSAPSLWTLDANRTDYDRVIHAVTGDAIEVPVANTKSQPTRDAYSLLEVRGSTFVEDHFDRLSLRDGALIIEDLSAGDYDLQFHRSGDRIMLRVVDGAVQANHVIGATRILELGNEAPPRIASVHVDRGNATIHLENATPLTRVHVMADYFHPAFDPFQQLSNVGGRSLRHRHRGTLPSLYVQGRTIGDELRYILERKYATKFPGNMLRRPQLLLHPWDVRDTSTDKEQLAPSDAFDADAPSEMAEQEGAHERREAEEVLKDAANLDFLASESFIRVNLKPDADGKIHVDLKQLEGRTAIYVVLVDQRTADQRTVYLPTSDRQHEDLRLANGLDPQKHFALTKQTSLFDADQTVSIDNLGSGRFQLYDSLPSVFQLYQTLIPDSHLSEFRFVLTWHTLNDDEKREKYSKYACHELNFFLSQKDPEFFDAVVRPTLRFKLHKTFLDEFLLGDDVGSYLSPWKYEQLNTVERILLAHRIDGELVRTLDFLQSQSDVIPVDQDRLNTLFDTGLLGEALALKSKEMEALERQQAMNRDGLSSKRSSGRATFSRGAPVRQLASPAPPSAAGEGGAEIRSMALSDEAMAKSYADKTVDGEIAGDDVSFGLARDIRNRKMARKHRLYEPLDQTKEWAENNYYRLPIAQQNADLIAVNDLWLDWARHGDGPAFRSTNFAQVRNFTEAMFALAVLDLPIEAPEHAMKLVEQTIQIQTAGPGIVLHEQIEPATTNDDAPPILISQNFFRQSERYATVNGQRVDRFVSGEFLYQTVYGCQLVVTNPTSSRQKLDVLTQLPTGAMPVHGAKLTQTVRMQLEPYHTQTLEYYFYFPGTGQFVQFPAHVTQDGQLVTSAGASHFNVVTKLSEVDRNSWDYVSQYGSDDDVMKFLEQRNLREVNLDRIAFRMGDTDLYRQTLKTLRQRHTYNNTLWSYAVHHNDTTAIGEFLDHADALLNQCGDLLMSPLVVINPIARKTYEHLEYDPLVNARAHQVGKQRQILNDRFHQQYHHWLKLVGYMRQMDDNSRLVTVYYLLLQDRLEDAISHFQQIDAYHVTARLQYDYCQAYLSMSQGETDKARSIATNYVNHPVDRWRNAFALVSRHLDEIEGKGSFAVDSTDRNQSQDELAAASPSFEFEVDSKQLRITYRNLQQVTVRYYLMDIELLFSRNPFVQRHQGQFAYIAPNRSETVDLPADQAEWTRALPEELLNKNVLVEIEAAGRRQSLPYYSNALSVQVIENYGQLRITHRRTHGPMSTVYCKVYARLKDGNTVFYKDGYTDLRGRFDYSSLSTSTLDSVDRFAILILSESDGATVREVNPPKR